MSWQEAGGSRRELRYHCKRCGNLATSVKAFPLPACPIPTEIFKDRIIQSGVPILARGIPAENQANMEYWIERLPKGKSAGKDEMMYEMWREEPEEVKQALRVAITDMLEGKKLPETWAGAQTKL